MILRCPSCGRRTGNVPDHLGLTPHNIRCRRCTARFSTAPANGEPRDPVSPARAVVGPPDPAERPGPLPRTLKASSAGIDDDLPAFGPLSPNDSQYEIRRCSAAILTTLRLELPAFTTDLGPSGETRLAHRRFEPPSSESFLPSSHGFTTSSTPGAGCTSSWCWVLRCRLLLRSSVSCSCERSVGGQILSSSITTLIVGCVGMIAFLLLPSRRPRSSSCWSTSLGTSATSAAELFSRTRTPGLRVK